MSIAEVTGLDIHEISRHFSPYRLGELKWSNCMILAPVTRGRAIEGNFETPIIAMSGVLV
jgi:hypothetical protein